MAVTLNALTTGVGGLQTTGDTSGAIQLQKDGTATVTVDALGNVGMGTTSPTYKLDILAGGTLPFNVRTNLATATLLRLAQTGQETWDIGMPASSSTFNFSSLTTANVFSLTNLGAVGVGNNYGTSGQFLKSNGPGAAATWGTVAAGGFSNMQVFTSPGTFTTPSTTTQIKVTVVGGGGAGGAAGAPGAAVFGGGGGGGGAGGAAIYVGPVAASSPFAVTVGTAGNTSSFAALASATGGSTGGTGTAQSTPTVFVARGGAGGAGGAGSAGTAQITGSAGGIGNAGNTVSIGPGGNGGSSIFAGGGASGTAGGNYGGGGGGGTPTGGAGAAGVVVVEY
jgi:hypothetical protein